jgi:hypothetical protein
MGKMNGEAVKTDERLTKKKNDFGRNETYPYAKNQTEGEGEEESFCRNWGLWF